MVDWHHPLSRDLLVWYRFNQGAGGSVQNLTGLSQPATLSSGTWSGSPRGTALACDQNDDVITTTLRGGPTDLSYACWVIIDSLATWNMFVSSYDPNPRTEMRAAVTTGLLQYRYNGNLLDGPNLTTGKLYHLVGATGQGLSSVYVDGTLRVTGAATATAHTDVSVGHRPDSALHTTCRLLDVRIWGRNLSAADVRNLYAHPKAGLIA